METKVNFLLKRISTEQFAILEENFQPKRDVNLELGLGFRYSIEERMIGVFLKIKFLQKKAAFLVLEVGCHFEIDQEAWDHFLDKDKTAIVIERGFACHIAMITVGTARGVLHSKIENTEFNNFLLPTINVDGLIKDDVVLEFDAAEEK